jgi:pimeloyl-ACP methyl ester carboxylesterase
VGGTLVVVLVVGCQPDFSTPHFSTPHFNSPGKRSFAVSPDDTIPPETGLPPVPPGDQPVVVAEGDCPDSRFHCVTLEVPRDHFSDDPTTWQVTFAIQRAAVAAKGTFVTITGGPGSAGIFSADSYTDAMAPGITDNYDIVFLNQRGSSGPNEFRCEQAAATYYLTDDDTTDPAQRDALAANVQQFVDDCIAESGVDVGDLAMYSTRQAAEDLDVVRRYLGVEQLHLYGESYGTQFVQTYAASHPQNVAALIVDGVVDLTTDSQTWYDEVSRAYDDALHATLQGCNEAPECRKDAEVDAQVAYDTLAATLAEGPIEFDFPMPDGTTSPRQLTSADLQIVGAGYTGSLGQRMRLQRAVAAAATGNVVPLARLVYEYLWIDPETFEPRGDPSWSDALYYAVECQDYSFPHAATPRERLDLWLDWAASEGIDDLRLPSTAAGDLPCLFWPSQPTDEGRPAPITDPPYTTFVMTADTDPATPMANALRVFGRLDDAYLIVLQNGPHVIFDWGFACVDDLISNYLAAGTLPPTRITLCEGEIADPYVPNAPDEARQYRNRRQAIAITADQIANHSEFIVWDYAAKDVVGCDWGGTMTMKPTDEGADLVFHRCEFTDHFPLSGRGAVDSNGVIHLGRVTTPLG